MKVTGFEKNYYRLSEYDNPKDDPLYNDIKTICENDAKVYGNDEHNAEVASYKLNTNCHLLHFVSAFIPLILSLFINWTMTGGNTILLAILFAISAGICFSYNKSILPYEDISGKYSLIIKKLYIVCIPCVIILFFILRFSNINVFGSKKALVLLFMYVISAIYIIIMNDYKRKFKYFEKVEKKNAEERNIQYEKTVEALRERERKFSKEYSAATGKAFIPVKYYWWNTDVVNSIDIYDTTKPITHRFRDYDTYNTFDFDGRPITETRKSVDYSYVKMFDFVPRKELNRGIFEYINYKKFISFDGLDLPMSEDPKNEKIIAIGFNWRKRKKTTVETPQHYSPSESEISEYANNMNRDRDFVERMTNDGFLTNKEMYYATMFSDADSKEKMEWAEKNFVSDMIRSNKIDKYVKNNSGFDVKSKTTESSDSGSEIVAFIINGRLFFTEEKNVRYQDIFSHSLRVAPELIDSLRKNPFRGYTNEKCAEMAAFAVHKDGFWQ